MNESVFAQLITENEGDLIAKEVRLFHEKQLDVFSNLVCLLHLGNLTGFDLRKT